MPSGSASWGLPRSRECVCPSTARRIDAEIITLPRPLALVTPAKSHPEVIVQAIAARDRARAEEFAKKHGIPEVKDSYQGMLKSSLLLTG